MRRVRWLIPALLLMPVSVHAALINNSEITVTGTECLNCTVQPTLYPPANTIDDDRGTFWHGMNALNTGDVNELVYMFSSLYDITQIDFFNDFTNSYNLGELALQYRAAGSWVTFQTIPGDFGLGDFTIIPGIGPTDGIRLEMEYQGRGAHGASPAFYLSEIDFYGDVCSPFPGGGQTGGCFPGPGPFPGHGVPEPTTILLLGVGLAGLGFARKRLH